MNMNNIHWETKAQYSKKNVTQYTPKMFVEIEEAEQKLSELNKELEAVKKSTEDYKENTRIKIENFHKQKIKETLDKHTGVDMTNQRTYIHKELFLKEWGL